MHIAFNAHNIQTVLNELTIRLWQYVDCREARTQTARQCVTPTRIIKRDYSASHARRICQARPLRIRIKSKIELGAESLRRYAGQSGFFSLHIRPGTMVSVD